MTTLVRAGSGSFCRLLVGPLVLAVTILAAADVWAGQWAASPLSWAIDGDSAATTGHDDGFALLQAAPISRRASVEAELELTQVVGDMWKVAGVAIVRDARNYWQLALVESPDSQQRRHFCELKEMRNGQWGAESNVRVVGQQRSGEPWQLGRRYRLRIALDPEGVEGSLSDAEGRVLERVRYAFADEVVAGGRPALRCRGFEGRFTGVSAAYSEPDDAPPVAVVPYRSDSFVEGVGGKPTGFFRVEQIDRRWWAIDPLGRGFVPLGADHINYFGHWCEKLGYNPHGRKNQAKYGGVEPWAAETLGRLRSWGFNLLGAGSSTELRHRGLAHTEFIAFGTRMADSGDEFDIVPDQHIPCSAFPNVFHPKFEEFCRHQAEQQCASQVGNPWLLGYFLDNELKWWGDGDAETGLFDSVMRKSAGHTAKLALRDFLARRYENDLAKFNRAWGTELESFDQVLEKDALAGPNVETVLADKNAFVALVAERYFSIATKAIREVDPDHMILGSRFAGGASDAVWAAAGRHCDILSFNYYGNVDLERGIARDHIHARLGKPLAEAFGKFYDAGRRPMMVTEWSFPALDAGLPSVHGAGQRFRTQAERARATEITAQTMLALPYMVGYDYFMWVDEPALGISKIFPEDSNYGLVNEDGQPYELLTAAFTRVHRDAGRLRREGIVSSSGEEPPAAASEIGQFLERRATASSDNASPHPALRFERQGEEFLATNGPWEIRGRIGGPSLADRLLHRGLMAGRFNGMVQQLDGRDYWPRVERLLDVKAAVGPTAMTLDLVGRYDAPPPSRPQSFEIAYRLTLLPECDWFVVQLLWCRNASDRPMDLRGIFFRLEGQLGGSAEDDVAASFDVAPRLWGEVNGDAWLDEKAGAFVGLVASDVDPLMMYFWLDEQGGQHPDARLEVERRLQPGETFAPEHPIGVLCVAGRGGRLDWQNRARKALDALGLQ